MAKKATSTTMQAIAYSEAETALMLAKQQADEILVAAKDKTLELTKSVETANSELTRWQSLAQQLDELVELTGNVGIKLDVVNVPEFNQAIEASVGTARQSLSEAQALLEIAPEAKIWGRYTGLLREQREAERAAKAAARDAVMAEWDPKNWALYQQHKSTIVDHGMSTLLGKAKLEAHKGLEKGVHATAKQVHRCLVDKVLPLYLVTLGFVAEKDGVKLTSFTKIADALGREIDPEKQYTGKPRSQNAAATVTTAPKQQSKKQTRANPKARRDEDDASEKPGDMSDIDAHFMKLEEEGPTAMQVALENAGVEAS